MIITLDGPCGSGKSTLAQLLAQKLGFFYMNSGYIYRSIAYILVNEYNYDESDLHNPQINHVMSIVHQDNFVYEYVDHIARVFFCGKEITHHLKQSMVSHHASIISAHQAVRNLVVPLQKKFGTRYDIVTDGRDCGTEIYPHADLKLYITALPEIRAQRLQDDSEKIGVVINGKDALQMVIARDERDSNRIISPLRKAHDAIEIDTSYQSVDQTIEVILSMI